MSKRFYPDYSQGRLAPPAEAFLRRLAMAGFPPAHELPPAQVRQNTWPGMRWVIGEPEARAGVSNLLIPGPVSELPARLYTPHGNGPFPLLIYFHGGWWVFWDLDVTDTLCHALATQAGCAVLSVSYRLAPEHKYPAGVEDAYAATQWAAANAAQLQGDPDRLAVAGDSAGGNLAAVVALLARDRGAPRLMHQLLICPVTNVATLDTPSYRFFAESPWSPKPLAEWARGHYLSHDSQRQEPSVSPLLATDLRHLPPATLITAEFDTLRDEGEAYAARLREAGVQVHHSRYDGMIHDFPVMAGLFDAAGVALAEVAAHLRSAFRSG